MNTARVVGIAFGVSLVTGYVMLVVATRVNIPGLAGGLASGQGNSTGTGNQARTN